MAETRLPGISISTILIWKMSFWPFVMCQVGTSESLKDIFPGGLINRGKNVL